MVSNVIDETGAIRYHNLFCNSR